MRCPTTFWNFVFGPRIVKYILTLICFYIKGFSHASDNDLSHQNTCNIKISICSTCAYFFFPGKSNAVISFGHYFYNSVGFGYTHSEWHVVVPIYECA